MKISAPMRTILPARHYKFVRKCYRFLRGSFYRGGKYECPFCGKTFRKMLPDGMDIPALREEKSIGRRRANARCPACSANDRERLVYLYLLRKTNLPSASRVKLLHVAPEENLSHKLRRLENVEYLSADLCSPEADIKLDVTNIRFQDNSFDAIICNHVLEHVADDEKAMSEIFRVLKPGGWAVLQVPLSSRLKTTHEDPNIIDPAEREREFGQKDHVRLYALEDYENRLQDAEFTVSVFRWSDDPGFALIGRRFALNRKELLVYVVKPCKWSGTKCCCHRR